MARAIEEYASGKSEQAISNKIPETDYYILDGVFFIHRVPWIKRSTYGTIADSYVDFTIGNYCTATIVFDGYKDIPSIKDSTHQRRQRRNNSPLVSVTPEKVLNINKEAAISRQVLTGIFSARLRERGCNLVNCELGSATLIGEDTDLLVLLLYHMDPTYSSLFFRSDNKARHQIII